MKSGKKRVLLALFLALTMVFSVVFGTVGALATGGSQYKINVLYKFGDTLIAQGQKTVRERDLDWDWDWSELRLIARVNVTEDYANADDVGGKAGYQITPGAQEIAKFYAGCSKTTTVVFQLSEVPPLPQELTYNVTVRYMAGSALVLERPYKTGTLMENEAPLSVGVNSADNMPVGYQLAAGEPSTKTVMVGGEYGLNGEAVFKVTQVAQGYSYIINVEYRYNGNLIRTGNTVTANVAGFIPLNVTVTPEASIIPAPYYLSSTASKVVAVSPSNNVQTVVFELADKPPVVIPDDDVTLDEPKTGTESNTPMIAMGFLLTIMAIGVSTVSFLKQRKSAK